jgi:hypothetical protein
MPVTYKIDRANGLIRTRCIGDVTLEEVIDHFRVLGRDPECPSYLNVLLDLSQQTSLPKTDNLRDVAHAVNRIRGHVRFGACAIVACTDAMFGMLRMFEVFVEHYFRQTSVFRTLPEAEVWLASQTSKKSTAR